MSGLNIQNSRIQQKYSTFSGETPTIAPSTDHTDGTWTPTDIYVGEVFFNVVDDAAWFRSLNGIVPLTSGATYISTYVNITGGTMTGGLVTPSLSATSITGTTIYSNNFNGVYYGDGSNLTGITATIFTGGTVSGNTIFTNNVDMCAAALSASTISGCGGELDIQGNLNVIGNISGNTFYGDGSGLTNLPSLTAVTLDNVLTQGDTSTNGNIVLTNGDMTLTNGTFFGDGSGLTNVPFGPTPTLDDVLQSGNTSTNYDILLTNGNIVLGTGIYYGDGSGLTNLPIPTATTQTLAEVLVNGNTTGNNDIIFNEGYKIQHSGQTGTSINFTADTTYTGIKKIHIEGLGDGGSAFVGVDNEGVSPIVRMAANNLYGGSANIFMIADDAAIVADATNSISLLSNSTNGITIDGGLLTNTYTVNDSADATEIYQTPLQITVTNPYASSPGIQYAADYSANFVDRTLVDKGYVDAAVSGSSAFTGYTYITEDTVGGTLVFSGANSITSTVTDGTITNEDYNGLDYSRKSYDNGLYTSELILDPQGNWDQTMIGEKHTSGGTAGYIRFSQGGQAIDINTSDGLVVALGTIYSLTNSNIVTTATDITDTTVITQTPNSITVTMPSIGIEYGADYSATYTNRSLVDKEYVDNSITGSTTASTISKLVKTYTTITDTVEVDPQGDNTRINSTNVANDAGAFVNVNSSSGVYLGATNAAGLSNGILYQGDIIQTYMNGAMYTTEKNKNTISNSATTAILTTSLGQNIMVDYEAIIFGAATGGTDTFYYKINTVLRITPFGVVTEMPGATIVQKSIGTTNQSVSYAFTNPLFQATINWTANKGTSTDGWDWEIKEKYIIKNLN